MRFATPVVRKKKQAFRYVFLEEFDLKFKLKIALVAAGNATCVSFAAFDLRIENIVRSVESTTRLADTKTVLWFYK